MALETSDNHPARMGQPWDDAEVAKLHNEIQANLSFEEIAKLHERTVGGVVAYLKNMAYHSHKTENKTLEEIILMTGLTDKQIRKAIEKRERGPISEKKIEKVEKKLEKALKKAERSVSSNEDLSDLRTEIQEIKHTVQEILTLLKAKTN
jgi:translation initiation factor 2 beta subunit (eIF-2beta)/eIF-5